MEKLSFQSLIASISQKKKKKGARNPWRECPPFREATVNNLFAIKSRQNGAKDLPSELAARQFVKLKYSFFKAGAIKKLCNEPPEIMSLESED